VLDNVPLRPKNLPIARYEKRSPSSGSPVPCTLWKAARASSGIEEGGICRHDLVSRLIIGREAVEVELEERKWQLKRGHRCLSLDIFTFEERLIAEDSSRHGSVGLTGVTFAELIALRQRFVADATERDRELFA
jgi:hypothetical protein